MLTNLFITILKVFANIVINLFKSFVTLTYNSLIVRHFTVVFHFDLFYITDKKIIYNHAYVCGRKREKAELQ